MSVYGVDKFPRMTDYVLPAGVRIADADRVRLGAHLAEGTTVMHEGFVNFNAGTLGASMVEGRISAGVVVGDGSDVGGGASIMGTLSGGGKEVISVGERCLLGANAGIGISLGDDCVVEAGCYVTAGTKVTVKRHGRQAEGDQGRPSCPAPSNVLFRRNSTTGVVEAVPWKGQGIELNADLHARLTVRRLAPAGRCARSCWSSPGRGRRRRRRARCSAGSGPLPDPEGCEAEVGDVGRRAVAPSRRRTPRSSPRSAYAAACRPARSSIALATAYQESKIRNLDHGDRDSLGLFQQRPSMGWGTAKQISDPYYATNTFYDELVKVDGYQTMRITEAAQEVQRSGFPEAYEDHAEDGRALASALTGYSPAARSAASCATRRAASREERAAAG